MKDLYMTWLVCGVLRVQLGLLGIYFSGITNWLRYVTHITATLITPAHLRVKLASAVYKRSTEPTMYRTVDKGSTEQTLYNIAVRWYSECILYSIVDDLLNVYCIVLFISNPLNIKSSVLLISDTLNMYCTVDKHCTKHILYSSVSQPLWDRGPVNFFFKRRGPGPNKFTRKYLSFFLSSYIKLK